MECTIASTYFNTHCDAEIVSWGSGHARSDPRHVLSTLYRTKEGAWYLYTRCGDKEDIVPMPVERVQELLRQRRLDYVLVRYFGEVVRRPQAATVL